TTFPTRANTGIDENGGYMVPVVAVGGTNVMWYTDSTNRNTIVPHSSGLMIHALPAGPAPIRPKPAQGGVATAPVPVPMYTLARNEMGLAAYQRRGCARTACHEGVGQYLDITSSGITEHDDLDVYEAITMAKNPEGGSIASTEPHSYPMSGQEAMGIVAYLRS